MASCQLKPTPQLYPCRKVTLNRRLAKLLSQHEQFYGKEPFLKKLIVSQPVKKFLAFCEIQKAHHRIPAVAAVRQMSEAHAIAFLNTPFSITVYA